jgi:hypothetical protein
MLSSIIVGRLVGDALRLRTQLARAGTCKRAKCEKTTTGRKYAAFVSHLNFRFVLKILQHLEVI